MDDRDLLRVAPVHDRDLDTAEVRAALAELGTQVVHEPHQVDRRRPARRRLVTVGLGVTATMAVAVPAAAGGIALWSGHFGGPDSTEESTAEYLDVTAPEFPTFARGLVAHLPMPPGEDLTDEITAIRDAGGLMQAEGVVGQLALGVSCDWVTSWLQAHDNDDDAGMATALAVLEDVPTWPEITSVDGDGSLDAAARFYADGARAGDPDALRPFSVFDGDVESYRGLHAVQCAAEEAR